MLAERRVSAELPIFPKSYEKTWYSIIGEPPTSLLEQIGYSSSKMLTTERLKARN